MKRKSFAKLNLMLDVVGKNEDGYHELEMIMVPIDLFDTIDIEFADKTSITSNKAYIPNDHRNTIIQTIELMRKKYNFTEHFKIRLQKNTPTRGGMGGGSSNASLVIRMVNDLLDLNMAYEEMHELAKEVGSDVPFTLYGKPALVSGIGENISPLDINIDMYIFIVKPKKGVSTPKLFKSLDLSSINHYDYKSVKYALENDDYDLFIKSIGNSLEIPASKLVPKIKKAKVELINFGFDAAIMSGAGSTVFAITKDKDLVNRAVKHFNRKYDFVKKTRIIKSVYSEENINKPLFKG